MRCGSQAEDVVVLTAPEDHPEWMMGAQVTDDGRYLVISIGEGCQPANRCLVMILALPHETLQYRMLSAVC